MSVKYQMTREGMQSMYTLAWRQRRARLPKADPMFSGYGVDQSEELADEDTALLETAIVEPSRNALLDVNLRGASERDRMLSRRVLDLLRLGYTGL